MSWAALKTEVLKETYYLDESPPSGQAWKWKLQKISPPKTNLEFETLGGGTNKRVSRIKIGSAETDWVLAFGTNSASCKSGFSEEIDALIAIRKAGVRVPEPFSDDKHDKSAILFSIEISDENGGLAPAFIMQYLPRTQYDEMPKKVIKEKEDFVKNYVKKDQQCLKNAWQDLMRVKSAFSANSWGDLQLMHHKLTGKLYVFDPQKTDSLTATNKRIIDKWISDVEGEIINPHLLIATPLP